MYILSVADKLVASPDLNIFQNKLLIMKALCLIILSFVTLMECGIVAPNQGKYTNYLQPQKTFYFKFRTIC